MYRTYNLEGNEDMNLVTQYWTGDCYAYSVFENKEEIDIEKKRIRKIEDDYKKQKEDYYNYLLTL